AIRSGVGLAYVPGDRKAEGLFLPLSIRDNIALATLWRRSAGGVGRRGPARAAVASMVDQLRIGAGRSTSQAVGTLSGGNQQKVLMAPGLLTNAQGLLLC